MQNSSVAVASVSSAEIIADFLYVGTLQTNVQDIIFLSNCQFCVSQVVLGIS